MGANHAGFRAQARTWTVSRGRAECSYSRKPTFSPTVRESKRAPLWNTIPMCSEVAVAGASSDSSPFLGTPCASHPMPRQHLGCSLDTIAVRHFCRSYPPGL